MISTNIKVAIRHLWKSKSFSVLNILGLSIGLVCCLFMFLFIQNELTFDQFHKNKRSIFRVAFSEYLNMGSYATTPLPVGPALWEQIPEVKAMTRVAQVPEYLVTYGANQFFEPITFADEEFFRVFSFPLVAGNPSTALKDPFSIVISERMARKYFGDGDPLNKQLKIGSQGSMNSVVKGVFRDLPQNSHLQFDCLVSFATMAKLEWPVNLWRQMPGNHTYVLLNHPDAWQTVQAKLPAFVRQNVGEELRNNGNPKYDLMLQPLLSIHLDSHLQREWLGGGSRTYVYLFAAIGIIVLLIASINFINFTTAQALKRTREIGIRKVMGGQRWQLVRQMLVESLLIYLLASALAMAAAHMVLPLFNEVSGKAFQTTDIFQLPVLVGLLLTGVITGLGSGLLPAWSATRVPTVEAIKGRLSGLSNKRSAYKVLVMVQFVASLVLMVAALVVYQQMRFVRQQGASGQADQVIVFPINTTLAQKFATLKTELMRDANVASVSASTNVPGFTHDSWPLRVNENTAPVQTENYAIEEDYLSTMGLTLVAGRHLDQDNALDLKENFVVNETAVRKLGYRSPREALGQTVMFGGDTRKRGSIVGVVKDFHITSLHEPIEPALFQFAPFDWMTYNYAVVRIRPQDMAATIETIRRKVAALEPNWMVDYQFFDDNFAALHQKDQQKGKVFSAFAAVAVLISCLGLLGLTMYAVERRTKEIGIRKVLGATIGNLLQLLSRDFLRLILAAAGIACPVAAWLMNNWLEDFAYRITISVWVFVVATAIILVLALATISFHALKAALVSPVKSLRTE